MNCLNVRYYFDWRYDADTKHMMIFLKETLKGKHLRDGSLQMGVTWLYYPSINYYRERYNLKWLKQVEWKSLDQESDYYYLNEQDKILAEKRQLRVITYFPLSDAILAGKRETK